jgi:hypothetical protein
MNEEYVNKLEAVISKLLEPYRDIPFDVIINGLCGYKVIPFDLKDQRDSKLLSDLVKVAEHVCMEIDKNPIEKARANEVGNAIEKYVKEAFAENGYVAEVPSGKSGKKRSSGYPDIFLFDKHKRPTYIECKTYNHDNTDTTQRSFYFSPSNDFKVKFDAHHLVISFEIFVARRRGSVNIYKANGWKILSLENLYCDIKHEFNSDNKRLYSKELILAEGIINSKI